MSAKGKIKLAVAVVLLAGAIVCIVSVAGVSIYKLFYPIKYTDFVEKYGDEHNLDKELIYAVIKTESSFNSDAVSSVGAVGLMQITPETFDWLKIKMGENYSDLDMKDAETSIKYGVFFLSLLIDEFGDKKTALAAYHAGRGRVNEWLDDASISPDGKTLENIPYKDTEYYVNKVTKAENIYRNLYDSEQ
jgi:soluble lytic murein transglycosylase